MASKKQQQDEQAEQDALQQQQAEEAERQALQQQQDEERARQQAAQDEHRQAEAADTTAGGTSDEVVVEGPRYPSRGAQVILTGDAQTAARGGIAGDIEGNTIAKKALEADGTVADGTTPDGSTRTGKPAPDVVVTEEAKPGGTTPAEEGTTRVKTQDPGEER